MKYHFRSKSTQAYSGHARISYIRRMILCIDTAVTSCNLGLISDGELVDALDGDQAMRASEILHTNLVQLLSRNNIGKGDLTAIAINGGPGSYTGLRIGASAAKGFCYALDIPLIHIDGLRLLFQAALRTKGAEAADYFIPMIDARRDEVFTGVYDRNGQALLNPQPLILQPDSFSAWDSGSCYCFGNGAEKARKILGLKKAEFSDLNTQSLDFTWLAWEKWTNKDFENTVTYTPQYLKPVHVTKPKRP